MLAVKEAQNLLEKAHIVGVDGVYIFNLPLEIVENTDKTVILLTDANSKPALYGNSRFNALNREIEVQIFYALDPQVDPEVLDVAVYRAFENSGWDLGENHGHTFDTDTMQITTSFYVYNLELL